MKATDWWIRDMDETTKRRVKAYAVTHGITIAQALTELVDKALGPKPLL